MRGEAMRVLALKLLAVVVLLTGCASYHIVMRHPDGRVAECNMGFGIYAPGMQRDCVKDFQRQGFERQP
jgi:hypothetical protein